MADQLTWGSRVRISENAPHELRPNAAGWICGVDRIDTEQKAAARGYEVGCTVFTVEFEDGSSAEVQDKYLLPAEST